MHLPENGLQALRNIVDSHIEAVALSGNFFLVIKEDGKSGSHLINTLATALALSTESIRPDDYIAGTAVIVPSFVLESR